MDDPLGKPCVEDNCFNFTGSRKKQRKEAGLAFGRHKISDGETNK
jgi:hypothetical protein